MYIDFFITLQEQLSKYSPKYQSKLMFVWSFSLTSKL